MRLSRVEEDIVTIALTEPGINIFDLQHRVKRLQHTYADIRQATLGLLMARILLIDDLKGSRIFFNRNQGKVYRGLTS